MAQRERSLSAILSIVQEFDSPCASQNPRAGSGAAQDGTAKSRCVSSSGGKPLLIRVLLSSLLVLGCSGSPSPTSSDSGAGRGGGNTLAAVGGLATGGTIAVASVASSTQAPLVDSVCTDTVDVASSVACRSVADCKMLSPVKCCLSGNCWPASACPLPPSMCPSVGLRYLCTTDGDCNAGGTCVSTISGCPQCETRQCEDPPPLCNLSPDSCGSEARCQTDGTCVPLSCTAGFSCPSGTRCSAGSARADGHGCELLPCNEGFPCPENFRCTEPGDRFSHGCTAMPCRLDADCDCGYCVGGSCASSLGICSQAPA